MYHALAFYDGFCADCDIDMPLVLIERGPRGVRAWLAGIGPEDRALIYTCRVCGRNEHVPLTEAEDAVYDATLPTWPDTVFALPAYVLPEVEYAFPDDEVAEVAEPLAPFVPERRRPLVRRIDALPRQRVHATDGRPLAVNVA